MTVAIVFQRTCLLIPVFLCLDCALLESSIKLEAGIEMWPWDLLKN